jgi:hypothetical protein
VTCAPEATCSLGCGADGLGASTECPGGLACGACT